MRTARCVYIGIAAVVLMGLAMQMAVISHLLDSSTGRLVVAEGDRVSIFRNKNKPLVPACNDWECKKPVQIAALSTSVLHKETRGPTESSRSALPSVPVAVAPPQQVTFTQTPGTIHSPASGRDLPAPGPGVDYFTANRAPPGNDSGVSTASMTDFIATGGRFPILMITCDRAEMLDKTLESLLGVRGVRASDVFVVQDGVDASVKAVLGASATVQCWLPPAQCVPPRADRRGIRYHQKPDDIAARGLTREQVDGGERIAQHYGYALR